MRRELAKVRGSAEFFGAIRPDRSGPFSSPGAYGSFLSHAAVIREAAWNDESVLILEDDCNFFPNARDYDVPRCDVFYGSHACDAEEMIGGHCMGFSARAVKLLAKYLADYLRPEFEPDARAVCLPGYNPRIRPPIDGAYVWFRRAYPELTTHFALLTYQRPSRSDCTPSHALDGIPIVRDAVEMGRRMREIFA